MSGGFGLPAEIVAAEAQKGASLEEIKAHAESLIARVRVIAVLDTLEYLKRGGRIGGARAMLGTLLNVKPLLEVRDSQVVPLERVRTRSKALERIGQLIAQLGPLEALGIAKSDDTIGQDLLASGPYLLEWTSRDVFTWSSRGDARRTRRWSHRRYSQSSSKGRRTARSD